MSEAVQLLNFDCVQHHQDRSGNALIAEFYFKQRAIR